MIFDIFKRKGLIVLKDLYWPKNNIQWPESWWHLYNDCELRLGLQQELHKEIGSKHSLWGLKPVVFAKSELNDDILVHLNNQEFAIVHLIWHDHIDQFPDKFPAVRMIGTEKKLQALLDTEY